ncbi:hypothetical protein PRIPAC_87414 [Pristionchus pacificus]|uniref:Uncharacterized protein n=1 Tax=Pristionchus pacificus TaxID=54126 RepID=A0A2A6CW48_PRIPA|nr:hypothetical protein PRIPAC_87414 [Pristionchus pacificus]|eukprot:PDM82320.1 hypothetical protein PRIPAC_36713 [Pristionchus pacificus]
MLAGFLPKFVRYVAERNADDALVAAMSAVLPSVLSAHPEWSFRLLEAGASLPPLQLAIRPRAERQPQLYIILDEDCISF